MPPCKVSGGYFFDWIAGGSHPAGSTPALSSNFSYLVYRKTILVTSPKWSVIREYRRTKIKKHPTISGGGRGVSRENLVERIQLVLFYHVFFLYFQLCKFCFQLYFLFCFQPCSFFLSKFRFLVSENVLVHGVQLFSNKVTQG